jgi:hypothetical protein
MGFNSGLKGLITGSVEVVHFYVKLHDGLERRTVPVV